MAKSSLCSFLETGQLEGNYLNVTVLRKVSAEIYIIGDTSRLAILELKINEKEIKTGVGIKLIKPSKGDQNRVKCNPHFKPMRTFDHDKISPSTEEIELLVSKAEEHSVTED